jgi:dinuclear metal center YbgI/SA1388 family protein
MKVIIKDIIHYLNELAPVHLQENYDNSGLLIGDADQVCAGVLVCLDSIESVVDEAINTGCNLIVAHHPIVFSGLKSLTGKNYIERVVIKAIQHQIAIYAIHTNLDNMLEGVNGVMAKALKLNNCNVLSPKQEVFRKLTVFVPSSHQEIVRNKLFEAGAGTIGNYSECSFTSEGNGTFCAQTGANPFVGQVNSRHTEPEVKIEVLLPFYKEKQVVDALIKVHPYEEVAYDVYDVRNSSSLIGAGIVGELDEAMELSDFLVSVKSIFNVPLLRYTPVNKSTVKRVAYCGGSGSFLLKEAVQMKADVFITADVKYHQFFDADGNVCLVDIGHYESEYLIIKFLVDKLKEKFTTFAVLLTNVNTNPINFL